MYMYVILSLHTCRSITTMIGGGGGMGVAGYLIMGDI